MELYVVSLADGSLLKCACGQVMYYPTAQDAPALGAETLVETVSDRRARLGISPRRET